LAFGYRKRSFQDFILKQPPFYTLGDRGYSRKDLVFPEALGPGIGFGKLSWIGGLLLNLLVTKV